MTPPHDPPRPALRLLGARPIPREEAQEELPPPVVAPDAKRLDTAIEDLRGVAPRLRRVERRQRRSVRVQLGTARAVRRCEAGVREVSDELGEVSAAVVDTQIAVGKAPDPETLARASSVDLSPAEVAKLDKAAKLGTGLHRRISEIEIRTARKAALGAAIGTGVVQAAIHLPDIIAAIARLGG